MFGEEPFSFSDLRLPRRFAGVILPLTIALALGACADRQATPPQTPLVLTAHATAASDAPFESYTGEVRARYEAPLSFRVAGQLMTRRVHLGESVRRGQLLAELDPQDASAQLAQAQAQLAAAESKLLLARQNDARVQRQAADELVSRAEIEDSASNLAVATSQVAAAREALNLARHQSEYTRLLAEADGVITAENADPGTVLAAGQPVFSIAYAGDRDAVIDVAEDRVARIKPGAHAEVTLWGQGQALAATVREVAQSADSASRTYRVKLGLSDAKAVLPGMTATVRFTDPAPRPGVLVPAASLFHAGNAAAVWVVRIDNHELELHRVLVLEYRADSVLVTGIEAGTEVVAAGVHTVTAGQVVKSQPLPAASA